jgi:hypothetical protein
MVSLDTLASLTKKEYFETAEGLDEFVCLNQHNYNEVICAILKVLTSVDDQCRDRTYLQGAISFYDKLREDCDEAHHYIWHEGGNSEETNDETDPFALRLWNKGSNLFDESKYWPRQGDKDSLDYEYQVFIPLDDILAHIFEHW